jgi:uncharacterized membrane protein YagU involved in acid resistance
MKNLWKRILFFNAFLWVLASVYCVYATTYGILSLDWRRFLYGIIIWGILTLIEVILALAAD